MNKYLAILIKILGFALAVFAGYLLGGLISQDISLIFFACLSFLLSLALQVIIHELGHLIAGSISGYKFNSFNIFGFVIVKEDGRLRIKRQKMAGMGGQCIMQPPLQCQSEIPFTLYLASGVIFNMIASLAVLPLLLLKIPAVDVMVIIFCGFGLYFVFTNGIPKMVSGIPNDIDNLITLKKNPMLIRYFFIQLTVVILANDKRLKEMDEELFTLPPSELNGEVLASSIAVFRFNMLMDSMRFEEAAELGKLLCTDYNLATLHEFIIYNDLLFLELVGENREDEIKKLSLKIDKSIKKAMSNYPSSIRTDYAYELLYKKDIENAEKHYAKFEKVSESYAIKTDIDSETDLINYAKNRALPV